MGGTATGPESSAKTACAYDGDPEGGERCRQPEAEDDDQQQSERDLVL